MITHLFNITCLLRPDLKNGFVRLESCTHTSHIDFSFEVCKGTHVLLILVLSLWIRASFPCSMECKCGKIYIFPLVPQKILFVHTVIFNREMSEKSKTLGMLLEKLMTFPYPPYCLSKQGFCFILKVVVLIIHRMCHRKCLVKQSTAHHNVFLL